MDNHMQNNTAGGFFYLRKQSKLYGLLVIVSILGAPGIGFGFSAEVGDTCAGISAGVNHTCIVNSEGNVYCYGNDLYSQTADYYLGDAVGVSAGGYHTCVLESNGNVDCYGSNNFGQGEDYTLGDAVGVSAGFYHTCVLSSQGNVYCYGNNLAGQAEDYTNGDAIGLSAGLYHTCVLSSDGNVYCYGNNNYGQAADYMNGDAIGVSVGLYHTCVLSSEDNVNCYGNNLFGQAEDYTAGDAVGVSTGLYNTCVLQANGNTECYGYDNYGQAQDYLGGDAIGLSAGANHTCVLTSDGYLNCYGANTYGQAENYLVGDAVCMPERTAPAHQPPVFDPIEPIQVVEYEHVNFLVTATDPDGDNFNYSCEGLPPGSQFDAANGIFSWTPKYDQAGTYTITFMAIEEGTADQTAQMDVTITVTDISPSALVERLIDMINNDDSLSNAVTQAYIANLKKVNTFIARGKITPAINQLNVFVKKVKADVKKGRLSDEKGLMFIEMANEISGNL